MTKTMAAILRLGPYQWLLLAVMISLRPADSIADEQRAIPDDNLAYPVLITLKNGFTGSGFYVNNGKEIYLVTAKHVLFDEKTHKLFICGLDQKTQNPLECGLDLLSYSKDPADPSVNLIGLDMSVLQKEGDIKPHPSADVVVVKLFTVTKAAVSQRPPGSTEAPASPGTLSPLPGVTVESSAAYGLLSVGLDTIKPFEKVLVGNDVIVFGYPTSLGLQELPQLDLHRPLLRKGVVAGSDPRKKSIVLDCPVYFGNSGGPVLELDRSGFLTKLSIIGVIDQYVPFVDTAGSRTVAMQVRSNSGYSIATPMDFVLELIK